MKSQMLLVSSLYLLQMIFHKYIFNIQVICRLTVSMMKSHLILMRRWTTSLVRVRLNKHEIVHRTIFYPLLQMYNGKRRVILHSPSISLFLSPTFTIHSWNPQNQRSLLPVILPIHWSTCCLVTQHPTIPSNSQSQAQQQRKRESSSLFCDVILQLHPLVLRQWVLTSPPIRNHMWSLPVLMKRPQILNPFPNLSLPLQKWVLYRSLLPICPCG